MVAADVVVVFEVVVLAVVVFAVVVVVVVVVVFAVVQLESQTRSPEMIQNQGACPAPHTDETDSALQNASPLIF